MLDARGNVNTMLCEDTVTNILSYLEYPDKVSFYTSTKYNYSLRKNKEAFEYKLSLVHRPWISPGKCVRADCNFLKCTTFFHDIPYTLSNYCWSHSSGRRATHISHAYCIQPDWFTDT